MADTKCVENIHFWMKEINNEMWWRQGQILSDDTWISCGRRQMLSVCMFNVLSSFKDASLYQNRRSKCKPCPVVHPSPVCGTDGHTYSTKVRAHPERSHLRSHHLRFVWMRAASWFFTPFPVPVAQCKLDYQACITGKKITVKCPGMCPCPSQPEQSSDEKKGTRFCTNDCTPKAIHPNDTVLYWVQTPFYPSSRRYKALSPN